jgi:hypothetical protein
VFGLSASAAFGGFFFFYVVGATGTGISATSTAFGATCSCFVATSGAVSRIAARYDERGSCDQTGNAKTGKDLFQVADVHNASCLVKGEGHIFPLGWELPKKRMIEIGLKSKKFCQK